MTYIDQQQTWILELGFKNNISADFKAWIMYNNPDIYSPTKQLSIKYSELSNLKQTHNYEYLKGTIKAPWHKFLQKLKHNININPDTIHIQQNTTNIDNPSNNDLNTTNIDNPSNNDLNTTNIDNPSNNDLNIDWKLKYHNLLKDTNEYKQRYFKEHKLRKAFNTTITQQRQVINNYVQNENKDKRQIQHITQQLNEIKIKEKQTRNELYTCFIKIKDYEKYIRECYNTLINYEKEINILKQENNSFKQDFKDMSSSSLSHETITQLQQQYEKISFPQYPTIICPITQEIMVEPVIAFDGQSYEKTAIEQWFQSNNKSPSNGTELPTRILIANHSLRKLIAEIVTST